ncbi:MAG: hypothetical protein K8953_08035, partial [Proteobacteria bacterium]|nr:hypothetical protein [Pseudomonadota bacterium]
TLGDSVLVEDFAVRLGDLAGNDNATSGFAIGGLDIANPAPSTSARREYVGILSGTDVGAPLPFMAENDPTAEWKGLVSLMSGTLRDYRNVPITLDVGFDGTAGTITTRSGGVNLAVDEDLVIDGKLGANGVICGTATFSYVTVGPTDVSKEGVLSGLIGMDGAVGVFGFTDLAISYVGGFVARPRPADLEPLLVNYADWAAATAITPLASGTATPPAESRFLTSTGDKLDTEGIPGSSTSVNLSTATNGGTALGGDTTDGFAYRAVSGVNDIFLVGISSTTDLGAPVDATTVLGTWKGSFVSVVLNSSVPAPTTTDFTLAVTFGDTASGNAGSVASGTIGATGYAFTGEFDSRG